MDGIKIHVINLARRPDRLEEMEAQLARLGLGFHRVDACDAKSEPEAELAARFRPKGPLGVIGQGDKACTISHFRAMQAILDSGVPGIVLEDDMALSDDFADVARNADWIPEGVGLVKLETYVTRGLKVLLGPPVGRVAGRELRPLLSRHTGGGAYAMTPAAARVVLDWLAREKPAVPIDHLLFNANVSPIADALAPVQAEPSMARQRRDEFGSDISGLRGRIVPKGLAYWKRETVRGIYEIRLLPRQVFAALFGGARLVTPRFAQGAGGTDAGDEAA